MPFYIVSQDITKMKVDAIVNAANTELKMGGGVCGAIFKAAGAKQLQGACDKLAPIKTGEAVITPGFELPAKYVIHTAGPVYKDWDKDKSEQLLSAAYTNSLKIAVKNGCQSIVLPLISSGIYGYPKDEALQVAISAIRYFLTKYDLDVTLVVFDKSSFVISRELMGAVKSYIDENYIYENQETVRDLLNLDEQVFHDCYEPYESYHEPSTNQTIVQSSAAPLGDVIANLDEPFSNMLLRRIDAKGKTDVEVYKRANIDRKLFSKIRSNKGYMPSKRTVIALAIALELSLDETDALLERAGYAFSRAIKFDVIVEYFILNAKYDIYEINQALFEYDQHLLGG